MYTWQDSRNLDNLRNQDDLRCQDSYAMQSQYAASVRIKGLIAEYQQHINPEADVQQFYDKLFNIYTAAGAGLDIWGRILEISRVISDPDTGQVHQLEDEHYRLLLLYKALANISASDAATQNRLLSVLIDTGIGGFSNAAYVLEIDVMAIRWVFESFLDPIQTMIFKTAGTLARGAGVGWEFYAITPAEVFGFDGSNLQAFGQAPFQPDTALVSNR